MKLRLRGERRSYFMIAVILAGLFLPFSFSKGFVYDTSTHPSTHPHCYMEQIEIFDPQWCIYERGISDYPQCIQMWVEHNKNMSKLAESNKLILFEPVDPTEYCDLPLPPEPREDRNCNELQTCPSLNCDITKASCSEKTMEIECPAGQILNIENFACEKVKLDLLKCIGMGILGAQWIQCEGMRCGAMNPNNPNGPLLPDFRPFPKPIDDIFRQACGFAPGVPGP
jgi:hypothetical protein